MLAKICNIIRMCKEPLAYVVFGILTTVVNIAVYYLMSDVMKIHYLLANIIAWICSVLFAFLTNKIWVFESRLWQGKIVLAEMGSFFLARAATGVMDMLLMWMLVDIAAVEEMIAKVAVNVLVIVLNYVASKQWIFRKKI